MHPKFNLRILIFTFSFLFSANTLAQLKCVEFMRTKAYDYIASEESTGRNHGECSLVYQAFEENKCHAWTAALWDPMLYEAKACAAKYEEIVCVHDITVVLPGPHNYIGITVSKDKFKSKGFAVDGWRCSKADQSRMSVEYPYFYEMHSIYDSGDDRKRFAYNINQPGNKKRKPVGHMVSKGGTPLWEPGWIEADGIDIGTIECFGGTPTPTKTPTLSPTITKTPTPSPSTTPTGARCGPDVGSCEYPSCCNYSGFCGTDPDSCGDDCNPEFGYCIPTPTPSPTNTETTTPSPTPTAVLTATPSPSPTSSGGGGPTPTPCPTSIGNRGVSIKPCEAIEARIN